MPGSGGCAPTAVVVVSAVHRVPPWSHPVTVESMGVKKRRNLPVADAVEDGAAVLPAPAEIPGEPPEDHLPGKLNPSFF